MRRTGAVRRILRATREVEVILQPGYTPVYARYLSGLPPPPLSRVVLEQSQGGLWTVSPTIATDRRVILHDDFTYVKDDKVNDLVYGDSLWLPAFGTPLNFSTYTQMPGSGTTAHAGAIRCTTGNNGAGGPEGTAQINTDFLISADQAPIAVPPQPIALWCSMRVKMESLSNRAMRAGFWNGLGASSFFTSQVVIAYDDSSFPGDWRMEVSNGSGGGFSSTTQGEGPQANVWQTFDVALVGDDWAASWVDGAGPSAVFSSIPRIAADNLGVIFGVGRDPSGVGAHVHADCDWLHAEMFTPATRPDAAFLERPSLV